MRADGGEGRTGAAGREDDDLPTAPSEQPTSAAGEHQETAPPTAGGGGQGEERARADGGGSIPGSYRLLRTQRQTQRNRTNRTPRRRGGLLTPLPASEGVSRSSGAEGPQHAPLTG